MRTFLVLLVSSSLLLLAACSSPESRIAENQAAFDRHPAEIQQKIRAGQVEVGFTPEMVRLALGKPTRVYTHRSEAGETEIWSYHSNTPQFSFGLGVGSASHNTAVGTGVGVTTGGYDPEEKVRVEFRGGRVVAADYLR